MFVTLLMIHAAYCGLYLRCAWVNNAFTLVCARCSISTLAQGTWQQIEQEPAITTSQDA